MSKNNSYSFAFKLDAVMNLADLSNAELGRLANIDASSISRFRNGQRVPKYDQPLVIQIAHILLEKIRQKDHLPELIDMASLPHKLLNEKDSDRLTELFQQWLYEDDNQEHGLIQKLLISIENLVPTDFSLSDLSSDHPLPKGVILETGNSYLGASGLQNAVQRFISLALSSGAKELLLYSDEPMDWMEDEQFSTQWSNLMIHCIHQGIQIKIIHNIDRSTQEMLQAIQSWMPLYLSGLIQSYYHKKQNGNRFGHTLFLCPGVACISSLSAQDSEGIEPLYDFTTDKVHLEYYHQLYQSLLSNSNALLRITKQAQAPVEPEASDRSPSTEKADARDTSAEETITSDISAGTAVASDTSVGETITSDTSTGEVSATNASAQAASKTIFHNVEITLHKHTAIVTKLQEPKLSFLFSHPKMIKAFQDFVKNEENHCE